MQGLTFVEAMTNTQAIRTFFETGEGRKVTLDEFKSISNTERAELAALCAVELGVEIKQAA